MNVNLIVVGKVKERYIVDGISEFTKRLNAFCKLKIIELKEEGDDSNRDISIEKESKMILETLEKNKGYTILLDIQGKSLSSEEMAENLQKIMTERNSTINLIIGGSYGVSNELKKRVNFRLSFSKMTFPHQLMRLILVEQLYRWFGILKNNRYHK